MKLFRDIYHFILFRYSFAIETDLNGELVKEILYNRIKSDKGFLYPLFDKNEFAFSHKNLMPKFYNFSPIIFEGKIKSNAKTIISMTIKIIPIFFWVFIFAILSVIISYLMNFGGMKDEFANTPFPLNPLFSPIFILIPYFYYAFKINDVRGIIKYIVIREEKRVITAPIPHARKINKKKKR